jgi:NAD+ synthetase
MVLGISGGIDSTVVAAICHEVSRQTGIPLIGRSLPTKYNKKGEITTADLVGKAFCDDYKVVPIHGMYEKLATDIAVAESGMLDDSKYYQSPLANGNIQARLRMIYLHNLASIYRGLVMDTDNLTENNLGYFTIHGDVGDFNPIGGLWKTEVFALASYIRGYYHFEAQVHSNPKLIEEASNKAIAIEESLKLKPTAGLGITDSDLDEIGADSYDQVDYILQEILAWKRFKFNQGFYAFSHEMTCDDFLEDQQMLDTPYPIVEAVAKRHFASEFKRKQLPIKISRNEIVL